MMLVNLAATAAMQGKRVYISTHEMKAHRIARRLDMRFTGMTKQEITDNPTRAINTITQRLEQYKSHIVIKQWPTGQATWQQVRHNMKLWEMMYDIKFDIGIVDYIALMRCTDRAANEMRFKLKMIAEGLRAIAGELDIPMWSGAQAQRRAGDKDVVGWQDISESVDIANTADVAISMNQTDTELVNETGRLFLTKNRDGRSGVSIPVRIQPDRCLITE
jgi:hypothetical protein